MPHALDRFVATGHAVQQQSPRHSGGKIDTTKHAAFIVRESNDRSLEIFPAVIAQEGE
jgi:hypothetical protein